MLQCIALTLRDCSSVRSWSVLYCTTRHNTARLYFIWFLRYWTTTFLHVYFHLVWMCVLPLFESRVWQKSSEKQDNFWQFYTFETTDANSISYGTIDTKRNNASLFIVTLKIDVFKKEEKTPLREMGRALWEGKDFILETFRERWKNCKRFFCCKGSHYRERYFLLLIKLQNRNH